MLEKDFKVNREKVIVMKKIGIFVEKYILYDDKENMIWGNVKEKVDKI